MAKTTLTSLLGKKARTGKQQRVERRRRDRPSAEGFWDRPVLINMVADLLLFFGVLALAYAALVSTLRLPLFPLRQVVVVSPLDQVTRTQIEYAVQYSLTGNFFTVDLDGVRTSFEKLPWVRNASVRRRWPDGIEVELEEHVAVARWHNSNGEARLVNRHGEVFVAALAGGQATLPLLGGPEGSAPQVLARYREFSDSLAALGRTPRSLLLSLRQAWQMRLDDGLTIELGREMAADSLNERLHRFIGTYAEAKTRLPGITAVDMRYPNGFAVRIGQAGAGRPNGQRTAIPDEEQNTGKGIT